MRSALYTIATLISVGAPVIATAAVACSFLPDHLITRTRSNPADVLPHPALSAPRGR